MRKITGILLNEACTEVLVVKENVSEEECNYSLLEREFFNGQDSLEILNGLYGRHSRRPLNWQYVNTTTLHNDTIDAYVAMVNEFDFVITKKQQTELNGVLTFLDIKEAHTSPFITNHLKAILGESVTKLHIANPKTEHNPPQRL